MTVSPRTLKLHRSVGKSKAWCQEFIRDFKSFNDFLSRRFRLPHKTVDRLVALAVEKQRLHEAEGEALSDEDLGFKKPREKPRRPRKRLSGEDLDQFLEELDF